MGRSAGARLNTKLLGVEVGENSEGEGPAVEASAEGDGSLLREHLRNREAWHTRILSTERLS